MDHAHAATVPTSRATPTTQDDLARVLRADLDALDVRLRRVVGALSPEQRRARPADGGWTADEVVEHMCLTNEAYLPGMRAMVDAARETPGAASRVWRATFLPGMLTRALERPRAMPAPRSVRPSPNRPARGLDALVATHDAVRDLLVRAEGMPWDAMRMRSPFAWFVRPNFGDACLIVVRHGERHAGQIERLAATLAH